MNDRLPPVVTGFDRWSAPVAVLVGVGVNLTGLGWEARFDSAAEWLRLVLCVLVGFTFLGLALVRSRRFGNDQLSKIVGPFGTQERQSITARRLHASTPAALAPVRGRYASAREETENRSVLLFGATATIFGAEPASTTLGVTVHLVVVGILLVAGVAFLAAAERWRHIAGSLA